MSAGSRFPLIHRQWNKIRIREAIKISKKLGEKVFKGYTNAPFAIILVTDSTEFLMNHPNPSADFTLSGKDEILNTNVYFRKARFNPHFLATFPAVNGLSCIVVGIPENTNKNSAEWIITLLHEHFHQYQNSWPDYFKRVNDLDLTGGDQTGMWMLNYPFPYDSLPVMKQYELFTQALYKVITNLNSKNYNSYLKIYLTEREKFKMTLSPADYRYFSFQVWQEGLARHTEYKFLQLLSNYKPSKEIVALPDFISFAELKTKMYNNEMKNLIGNNISEARRVSFYAVGFAEGILLDRLNQSWRKNYMDNKFYIERYFNPL